MNIITIIPARGGSKGIPKKNIKDFCGKPLIAHSIEQSLGCKFVNRTIVSTDSEEIASVSRKFGAEVFIRPKELAQDNSPSIDTTKHVLQLLEEENYQVDIVILLQPTSPLRTSKMLSKAITRFQSSDVNMLVSVSKSKSLLKWFLTIENNYLKFLKDNNFGKIRRQDQSEDIFSLNGSIYIFKKEIVAKCENYVWSEKTIPFEMEKEYSFDIDTQFDFDIAEFVMKLIQNENKNR